LEEFAEEKISRQSAPHPVELGLELAALDANLRRKVGVGDLTGVIVVAVAAKGSAAAAGIERGDIIKEVNRRPVKTPDDFYAALRQRARGQSLLLLIKRSGGAVYLLL
jgi:serine protease Do